MASHEDQLQKLKELYESGVLTKDLYEAAIKGLGDAVPDSQVEAKNFFQDVSMGFVGDHSTIHGNVIVNPPDSSKPNADEILRNYRNQLLKSIQHLPLRGIDTQSSDPSGNQTQLAFDRVYVGLDTTTRIQVTETKEKSNKEEGVHRNPDTRPLSVLEAAAAHRSLVILGDPGSGKSTFVNHLILCLCREKSPQTTCDLDATWPKDLTGIIPIQVIIRDFAQWIPEIPEKAEAKHLWEFIFSRLKSQMLENAADLLKDALDNGHAIVLLDGLDEIPSTKKRQFIRDAVNAFSKRYDKSRFIVTCRVLSYQNPDWQLKKTDFPTFELAAFDEPKIDLFISAWYQDLMRLHVVKTPEECTEWIRRLKTAVRRRDLWRLAPNPLLLTVMALVHTHKGRLPDARSLLYEECVEILLWRWDQVKTTGQNNLPRLQELLSEVHRADVDLRRLLWKLAFETHEKSEHMEKDSLADISEGDLINAFSTLHPERSKDWACKVLDTIKMRAGLLIEREPGVYSFPHRTFQEYLAGAYLSTQAGFAKNITSLIEKGNFWREAVLLAVGRLVYLNADSDKPLALVGELCPSKTADSDVAWRKVWMAGDVLVEIGLIRVQDSHLGQDLLNRLRVKLTTLLEKGRLAPKERVAAGNTLSYLGDPRFDPENWGLPVGEEMGFIQIPAGSFMMGSDKEKDSKAGDKEMPHRVKLSAYAIGRYPVTVAAFRAFVRDSGYHPEGEWEDYMEFSNHPVVNVTWNDAVRYCEWLTEKLKEQGFQVRLPTEAQWEYAARGTDGRIYPCGNKLIEGQANYSKSKIDRTSPVGAFPDDISFYQCMDMTGNVWEWCHDWYDRGYYGSSPSRDPKGPDKGGDRVIRGGCWGDTAEDCRSSYRGDWLPVLRHDLMGFRLALLPGQQ